MLAVGLALGLVALESRAGADPPTLGRAEPFAVLAGATVTNVGPSIVVGNLGVSPGTEVTGAPDVRGETHTGPASPAAGAQLDARAAYVHLAGEPCPPANDLTGTDLGGRTLTPGVYCFSSEAQLTGTLTLDFQGNPNALFVFKIGTALTTASASVVTVINAGGETNPCNVFWQVGSSATLGSGSDFLGTIIADQSITANSGTDVLGRLFAIVGQVSLNDTEVTRPVCGPAPPTSTSTSTSTSTTTSTTLAPATTTTVPPITIPPITVTVPPITVTLPPVTIPPITVTIPPITIPPITVPPITTPPVTVTLPPITLPPITLPPITVPPITEPPITLPPITVPPITIPGTTTTTTSAPTTTTTIAPTTTTTTALPGGGTTATTLAPATTTTAPAATTTTVSTTTTTVGMGTTTTTDQASTGATTTVGPGANTTSSAPLLSPAGPAVQIQSLPRTGQAASGPLSVSVALILLGALLLLAPRRGGVPAMAAPGPSGAVYAPPRLPHVRPKPATPAQPAPGARQKPVGHVATGPPETFDVMEDLERQLQAADARMARLRAKHRPG